MNCERRDRKKEGSDVREGAVRWTDGIDGCIVGDGGEGKGRRRDETKGRL